MNKLRLVAYNSFFIKQKLKSKFSYFFSLFFHFSLMIVKLFSLNLIVRIFY